MTKILIALVAVSLILNFFSIPKFFDNTEVPLVEKRTPYPFLAKRIFLENPNDMLLNFTSLRSQLNEYVKGQSFPIGLYFEYLPTGVSVGINQNGQFVTASLLKIPIAMAIYKDLNNGRLTKDQKLTIKENHIDTFFGEGHKRKVGSEITVEEALHDMIILSDNTAKNVLLSQLSFESLADIAESLDIPLSKNNNLFETITPKNYSSVLRSLFFSAYLDFANSNNLLMMLSETPFKDKLVAGIPEHIRVAHKIGVFEISGDDSRNVFSDCGIVYVPNRSYILCMMTASNEKDAQSSMSAMSKMVYEYIVNKP